MSRFLNASILHVGNFLAQYHYYVFAYIVSSFLAYYVGVQYVGYIFMASSAVSALVLYAAPPIFRAFGTRNVLVVLTLLEITILLGLAITTNWIAAAVLVALQGTVAFSIFIGIDLLIEASIRTERVTGRVRTAFLIVSNLAVLLGALSLTFVVEGDQYWRAFVTSAIVLLPFLAFALWLFPRVSLPQVVTEDGSVLTQLKNNKSLRAIVLAHFLLQVFFAWMAIYSPILLFSYEGFSWAEIGTILAIAMLPYIVLEYPLGVIADRWLGEKEILIGGFVIIALSMLAIPLIAGASYWVWVSLLVISRIGAAAVEAMTEVHFFRHVSERDAATITVFRTLRPLGNIAGPLVASLALLVLPLHATFALFGVIMLLGIPVARMMIDSK
ncbi:MAG: MFS transporter [Candidatus Pacebacteria bacterium]|nr:MFS transporter [Candidatus Paceibacterota bacterium]